MVKSEKKYLFAAETEKHDFQEQYDLAQIFDQRIMTLRKNTPTPNQEGC